jgi:conjugative transfer signal peptidase TraF
MKTCFHQITIYTLISGVSFLILLQVTYQLGFRFNHTNSIPRGFYKAIQGEAKKGDYVILCPPKNEIFDEAIKRRYLNIGFCPGDYGRLMKKILAAKKDHVKISSLGVFVNHQLIPLSQPLKIDLAGRKLPQIQAEWILKDDELLLMGDNSKKSFDSRYYGLINKKQIESVIKPFYIF